MTAGQRITAAASILGPDELEVPRYYAVPDPADPGKMTYWFRSTRGWKAGRIQPWPPRVAKYWPLYAKDLPDGGRGRTERDRAVIDAHFARVREYLAQVEAAIERDPDGCSARFAAFASRCCVCSKILTDERSKVYGIGPECRHGMSEAQLSSCLDFMRHAIGRMFAEDSRAEAEL